MADLIDNAQALEELHRDAALSNRTLMTSATQEDRDCIQCGNPIPIERVRAVNATRCVGCQERLERRRSFYK